MNRSRPIHLAARLLLACPLGQELPSLAPTPVEVAPAGQNRDMGAPSFAPAELGDGVPLPERVEVRAGERGDTLASRESEDPYFLGFAGGRHYPAADERLDPELVASALQARSEGRGET